MDVRWLTAFIDLPVAQFDAGVRFWADVTESTLSARRGDNHEFASLIPPQGDSFVRVQRIDRGTGGIHLDLHVENIASVVTQAVQLGAGAERDLGSVVVMSSPAGLAFCVVAHHGEALRPAPVIVRDGVPALLDQVCIDVPAAWFETECAFWAALTGWEQRPSGLPEFSFLVRPPGIALRLLIQRLGGDDPPSSARAHLDVACGTNVDAVVSVHQEFGAAVVHRRPYWTTMVDPAGLAYCLTSRDPSTGVRPT